MAYALTSARGDVSAHWADHVDKVVLAVDLTAMSLHLTVPEAAALAAQLTAAVNTACASEPSPVPGSASASTAA